MAQSNSITGKTCPTGTLAKKVTKHYNQVVQGKPGQTITTVTVDCYEKNADNLEPFIYYKPECHLDTNIE